MKQADAQNRRTLTPDEWEAILDSFPAENGKRFTADDGEAQLRDLIESQILPLDWSRLNQDHATRQESRRKLESLCATVTGILDGPRRTGDLLDQAYRERFKTKLYIGTKIEDARNATRPRDEPPVLFERRPDGDVLAIGMRDVLGHVKAACENAAGFDDIERERIRLNLGCIAADIYTTVTGLAIAETDADDGGIFAGFLLCLLTIVSPDHGYKSMRQTIKKLRKEYDF